MINTEAHGGGVEHEGGEAGKEGGERGAATEKRRAPSLGDRFSCDLTYILGLHIRSTLPASKKN